MSRITTILCLALSVLCACRKNNNGGTFSFKGRWLEDCGGAPVANKNVNAVMYIYGFNKKDRYSASGVTDADGNFSITLPNHGATSGLSFDGGAYIPVGYTDAGDGNVYDLGTVYSRCSTEAVVRIRFSTPHADTFYIGSSALSAYDSIYPATGTAYMHLANVNRTGMDYNAESHSYQYSGSFNYLYGFGWKQYFNTLNVNGGPKLAHIANAFSLCSPPDTVEIDVP